MSKKYNELPQTPHSTEAEQATLGSLIIKGGNSTINDVWDEVIARISSRDFYISAHQKIFETIQLLINNNQVVDLVTIQNALDEQNLLEQVGGLAYLGELADKIQGSTANLLAYVEIVKNSAIRRNLIQNCEQIIQSCNLPANQDINELLDQAESKIFRIAENYSQNNNAPDEMHKILEQTLNKLSLFSKYNQGELTGVTTGYKDLDKQTSGLQAGDLIIIAGRPAMGKTTFALNVCQNIAMQGQTLDFDDIDENGKPALKPVSPVLVFSLEMPKEQLAIRMLASLASIDQTRIKSGAIFNNDSEFNRLNSFIKILEDKKNIFIDDRSYLTPNELRATARRLHKEHGGLGLIMIDYLQLIRVPGFNDNKVLEISEISRSLKALAKELNVPVIALAQLNRGVESRLDKRPLNSDLRESGAIEQDADLILFIYREEVYNKETEQKNIAEIIIGKHRNGPIGTIKLGFNGAFSQFTNLDEYHHEPENYYSDYSNPF